MIKLEIFLRFALRFYENFPEVNYWIFFITLMNDLKGQLCTVISKEEFFCYKIYFLFSELKAKL